MNPRAWRVWLVLATLSWTAVLVGWATFMPPLRAADEPAHLSTTLRLLFEGDYPAPGTATVDPAVWGAYEALRFPDPYISAPLGPRPEQSQTLGEIRASTTPTSNPDQMTQHPPLTYLYLAGVAAAIDAPNRLPSDVLFALRLACLVLLIPLPLLIARAGLLVGLPAQGAVAAAWVPVGWPHLAHIGASVSNAAMLILTTTLASLGLLMLMGGDFRRRVALGTGVAVTAALLTKGYALGLGPAVIFAWVVAARRHGARESWAAFLLLAAACIPGLAWYVGNLVRFGAIQPGGWPEGFFDASLQGPVNLRFLMTYADGVSNTLWFNPLEFEIPLPTMAHRLITLGVGVAVALAIRWAPRRPEFLLLAVAPLMTALLALYGTVADPVATGTVYAGARGRYLQVGVVVLAVAIGVVVVRAGAQVWLVVPVVAVLLGTWALVVTLDHFWVGETLRDQWGTAVSWWPGGQQEATQVQ